tara:strand:+ start:258 stop:524 length:267 start_codon:yes stop_codon:yes gene_type:complete
MPSKNKCRTDWKKMGYKSAIDCVNYGKKALKDKPIPQDLKQDRTSPKDHAGTSVQQERDMVGQHIAGAKNWRMKRRLKRQASSGPKGY